jgi:hypothetical protein
MYPFPGDYFEILDMDAFLAAGLSLPETSDGQKVLTTIAGNVIFKDRKLETYEKIAALVSLEQGGQVVRYTPEEAAAVVDRE